MRRRTALAAMVGAGLAPAQASSSFLFSANLNGTWDLFEWKPGVEPRPLTSLPVDERAPALSPDGKRVACSTGEGRIRLISMDSLESSLASLAPERHGSPHWLTNNELVITSYATVENRESSRLLRYDTTQSKASPMTLHPGAVDFASPEPGGSRLAYVATIDTRLPEVPPHFTQDFCLTSLANGETRRLILDGIVMARPAWSMDRKSILLTLLGADAQSRVSLLTVGPTLSAQRLPLREGITGAVWFDSASLLCLVPGQGGHQLQRFTTRGQPLQTLLPFGRPVDLGDLSHGRSIGP